jgi:formate hydrogenlyase subunit 3/multisubunit Na+/H+ antiporter MnhD subunit
MSAWLAFLPMLGPLPGLAAALMVPIGARLEVPWLFLGTALGLDATAQVYLLFTSLLWLTAGIYTAFAMRGSADSGRFSAFFLLAMAGNLWLIVGQDLFSFYAGFAMMSLASYGLVIHDATPSALRAGKVYLVMALLGEVCLFAALVIIAEQTGSTEPSPEQLTQLTALPIALALIGLGVKAGLVPLHLWLPLAHPAAPVPASAVLSGTMIKVAILGWLRFLPVGVTAMPEWGGVLAAGGMLTLLYALPIGMVQADPKAVLAYSSVSKMGLMMLTLGLVLIQPALAPVGVAAIVFFAANHALVKGGLFLGVGLRKHATLTPVIVQPLVLGALVFLALILAGAPFTSGAVAKYQLKPVLDAAEWTWVSAVVAIAAVGTTLLMGRFVWISVRTRPQPEPGLLWPALAWAVLIALAALLPFLLGQTGGWVTNWVTVPLGIVLAGTLAFLAWLRPSWFARFVGLVPQGDLIVLGRPIARFATASALRVWRPLRGLLSAINSTAKRGFDSVFSHPAGDTESALRAWPVAGALWVGILSLLLFALLSGSPLLRGSTGPSKDASGTAPPDAIAEDPLSPLVPIRRRTEPCEQKAPATPPAPTSDAEAGETGSADGADAEAETLVPERRLTGTENVSASPQPEPGPSGDGNEAGPSPQSQTEPQPEPRTEREPEPQPDLEPTGAESGEDPDIETRASESTSAAQRLPMAADPEEAETESSSSTVISAESASALQPVPTAQHQATGDEPNLETAEQCAPPKPYLFRVEGIAALELNQCATGPSGSREPLAAPQPSRALVTAVQQTLQQRGYNPGPADGLMGPRTASAIGRFQRERGLEDTGRISFALLDQLQASASP